MHWVVLFIAGFFEAGWAIGLKYTEGWTRFWPSVFTGVSMIISLWLLAFALREIPVGTGYAIWTGIGATIVAILGIVLFGESANPFRLLFIAMIVCGLIGLKLSSTGG